MWCFCSRVSIHAVLIITNLSEQSGIKRNTSPGTSSPTGNSRSDTNVRKSKRTRLRVEQVLLLEV